VGTGLSYAVVTPARDEADNLRRLAPCIVAQTVLPAAWVIVDNGSSDKTYDLATGLAREHAWIHATAIPGADGAVRGGPVIRAFNAGVAALPERPDVVVKLDADVSFEPTHFERLLEAFAADPALGIASGSLWELEDGVWRQQFTTRASARGAARAYRWECLEAVSPLEEAMGWDGIDELKANVRGWKTGTVADVPFRHHRQVGERDASRRAAWQAEGKLAHYMGYRFDYLLVRALYRSLKEPAALAMVPAYAGAALRREARFPDEAARAHLREQQRLRHLPARAREAFGKRSGPPATLAGRAGDV
jgi:glycosyltransferase involved in cell wall biosynthesis